MAALTAKQRAVMAELEAFATSLEGQTLSRNEFGAKMRERSAALVVNPAERPQLIDRTTPEAQAAGEMAFVVRWPNRRGGIDLD